MGSREVRLTNLENVFFPKVGLTKGDLIRYYLDLAPHVLNSATRRPMNVWRLPHSCDKRVRRFERLSRACVRGRCEDADSVAVDLPETRYARSGDVSIAYQVMGDGPFDLVFIPPFLTHAEVIWTTSFAPSLLELSSFCRLIRFDKRARACRIA